MKTAALVGALLLFVPAPAAAAATPKQRPNLLVIMTDDQRADGTLEVMPQTRHKIARQGTTFLNAHATTPKCCPSRSSFFTGLYVHNHHVISNASTPALDHSLTVQHLVRAQGYRTGIFGKFLNGWPVEANPPYFDHWAITNGGYEGAYWNLDGRVGTKSRYTTDLISDRTARFIRDTERHDAQPWLAWVTPSAPHTPSIPARRDRDAPLPFFRPTPAMEETDFSDKPGFLDSARNDDATLVTVRDDGRRSLMSVDDMVGRLMVELRELGERDNTLVVFTSDNGFMLGEHGGVVGKDLPYPASTGIPMIARWPGHFRAGRSNRKFVTNIDVATTMLKAAGVRPHTDGRSLLAPGRRKTLYTESRGARNEDGARSLPPFRSLTTSGYRFAEYYKPGTYDLLFREYYDLRSDPWELSNIAPSVDPARIAALSQRLAEYGTCKGRACP